MKKSLLDDLLEQTFEIKGMVSNDEIADLVENSIINRSLNVLLVEAMRSQDVSNIKKIIDQTEKAIDSYGKALQAAKPAPAYLVKLLAKLKKQLQSRRNQLDKTSESDDIRAIVKYKDSVSDIGILTISALRTIRDGVDTANKLIKSMGEEAFNPVGEEAEDSQDFIDDLEKSIKQSFADNSLAVRLKPEVRSEFENSLMSKVEKPSLTGGKMRQFFAGITKSGLKVDPRSLVASLSLLTLEDLQELDAEIKSVDGAVKKATETTEDTSEEFQTDENQENENSNTEDGGQAEQAAEEEGTDQGIAVGDFYRYKTKSGKEGIYKIDAKNDNGSVRIQKVAFEDGKIKLSGAAFAVSPDKLDDKVGEEEVKKSLGDPENKIKNVIRDAETASEVIDQLKDASADDLTDAAASTKAKTKITREQGLKMFGDVTQTPAEAGFLYATVKRVINDEVGYDMFENKQEVDNLSRWMKIAGIKEVDK